MPAEPTPDNVHNQARQEVLGELRDTLNQMPVHDEAAPEAVLYPELAALDQDTRSAVNDTAKQLFGSDSAAYQEQVRVAADAKRTEQARRKAGSRLRRLDSGMITDYRYRLDAETAQILAHDDGLTADHVDLAIPELKRAVAEHTAAVSEPEHAMPASAAEATAQNSEPTNAEPRKEKTNDPLVANDTADTEHAKPRDDTDQPPAPDEPVEEPARNSAEQLEDPAVSEPVTDEITTETTVDTDQPIDGEYAELDDIDPETVDQVPDEVPASIAADDLTAAQVEILLNRYKAGESADPRLAELVKTHQLDELGREIRAEGKHIRAEGKAIREDGSAIRREGAAVRAEGAEIRHTSAGLRATGKSATQQRLDRQFTAEHEQLKAQPVTAKSVPTEAVPVADEATKPAGWLRRTWRKMLGRRDTVRDQLR